MSDKNNGPADSNKIQPGFAWGTASNQQSQKVFWDTTKYKKMAEEAANNCQTKVNNYHGKENSDDSYDSDDNDGIDSMTDEEIISKFGKFAQDIIESGLVNKEKTLQFLKQTLKQKKKQINHTDEKHASTWGNSDAKTNIMPWMKDMKDVVEKQQKNNNTNLQTNKLDNKQNIKSFNSKVIHTDMGTFHGVEIYNEEKDGVFSLDKMKENYKQYIAQKMAKNFVNNLKTEKEKTVTLTEKNKIPTKMQANNEASKDNKVKKLNQENVNEKENTKTDVSTGNKNGSYVPISENLVYGYISEMAKLDFDGVDNPLMDEDQYCSNFTKPFGDVYRILTLHFQKIPWQTYSLDHIIFDVKSIIGVLTGTSIDDIEKYLSEYKHLKTPTDETKYKFFTPTEKVNETVSKLNFKFEFCIDISDLHKTIIIVSENYQRKKKEKDNEKKIEKKAEKVINEGEKEIVGENVEKKIEVVDINKKDHTEQKPEEKKNEKNEASKNDKVELNQENENVKEVVENFVSGLFEEENTKTEEDDLTIKPTEENNTSNSKSTISAISEVVNKNKEVEEENKTNENKEKKEQKQKNVGMLEYLKEKLLKIICCVLCFFKGLKDKFSKSAKEKENNKLKNMINNSSQQQDFSNEKSKTSLGTNNMPKQSILDQQYSK